MENYTFFTKKLGIKEIIIEKCYLSTKHCFDASSGKVNSAFGFITKGTVTLNSMNTQISLPAGSLFYVPDNVRYNSVWFGNPDIEYYCLHMVASKYDLLSQEPFLLQHIPAFSTVQTERFFDNIYHLLSSGKHVDALKALGNFYSFYADVLPHLKHDSVPAQNPLLLSAIEFIEKNVNRNFAIDELAAFCAISESRLHHLFQNELKTTPIKYRNRLRIENAAADLLHTDYGMDKIAEINGFHSTTYFREIFKQHMGVSPAKYRRLALTIKNPLSE